jgi:uncharacterized protein (TIGR04255 family)
MKEPDSAMPSYAKPPVIEVVWSVQFAELRWLLAAHTGLFWQRIRDRYPDCQEQAPLAHVVEQEALFAPAVQQMQMLSAPPLSRQWYISGSGNELVQLQRDRFCCNWRQVRRGDAYPRYAHMRDAFESNWRTFCDFVADVGKEAPSVDQCEMTYINHVDQGQGWESLAQVGEVFHMVQWQAETSSLPGPETLGARVSFGLPQVRGRLHVSLRHGMRTEDGSGEQQLLVLELTARGAPLETDVDGLLAWYEAARGSIVRAFTELTTPSMHARWERQQ